MNYLYATNNFGTGEQFLDLGLPAFEYAKVHVVGKYNVFDDCVIGYRESTEGVTDEDDWRLFLYDGYTLDYDAGARINYYREWAEGDEIDVWFGPTYIADADGNILAGAEGGSFDIQHPEQNILLNLGQTYISRVQIYQDNSTFGEEDQLFFDGQAMEVDGLVGLYDSVSQTLLFPEFEVSLLTGDEISISVDSIQIDGSAQTQTVTVTSNTQWESHAHPTWAIPDPLSGSSGETIVNISVDANLDSMERESYINFATPSVYVDLPIIQDYLTLFSYDGPTGHITIPSSGGSVSGTMVVEVGGSNEYLMISPAASVQSAATLQVSGQTVDYFSANTVGSYEFTISFPEWDGSGETVNNKRYTSYYIRSYNSGEPTYNYSWHLYVQQTPPGGGGTSLIIGDTEVSTIYLGDDNVVAIYVGDNLVFE